MSSKSMPKIGEQSQVYQYHKTQYGNMETYKSTKQSFYDVKSDGIHTQDPFAKIDGRMSRLGFYTDKN